MVKEMLELNMEKKHNFLAINNVDDSTFEFKSKRTENVKKKKKAKDSDESSSSSEIEIESTPVAAHSKSPVKGHAPASPGIAMPT